MDSPDVIAIVTGEGMAKARGSISANTQLVLDGKLREDAFPHAVYGDFQKKAGKQGAALSAVTFWLIQEGIQERKALLELAGKHKHGESLVGVVEKVGSETTAGSWQPESGG